MRSGGRPGPGRRARSAPSCGGSCAPANLWWEENGATYQIQLKLSSATDEREQERLLVETANSVVPLR